ncbi:MAG: prepilin-type N-terminal cleavage/methylation domain-containing protein [Armatimonadota bacterium]
MRARRRLVRRGPRAFTLIELLVVIAIIAVLGAIIFPVFSRARAKARQAKCVSNARQLALAIQMYTQDYEEQFPWANNGPGGSGAYGGWVWYDTFPVPEAGSFDVSRGSIYPYTRNVEIYVCPDDNTRGGCSYELNGYLRGAPLGIVRDAAGVLLLIEEEYRGTANDGFFDVPCPDHVTLRHNDGSNFAFVDGHAKWHKWADEDVWAACEP